MPVKKLTPQQIASIHHQANNGISVVALCAKYNLSSSHIYRIKHNTQRNRKTKKLSTYNGWTNHATWLFYLHHQEDIQNWYYEQDEDTRVKLYPGELQAYFEEVYLELINGVSNIYITDIVNNEFRDINWEELLKTVLEIAKPDNTYDANWTEEGAYMSYMDHVAENKERERN
jgi:hypothetical protein